MVVKRPGIVTILAILAFVAAVLTGYKLLIYLGIVPPSLGALAFFGRNSVGAVATGIKFVVLLAVMYGLWTMRPWGWLLTSDRQHLWLVPGAVRMAQRFVAVPGGGPRAGRICSSCSASSRRAPETRSPPLSSSAKRTAIDRVPQKSAIPHRWLNLPTVCHRFDFDGSQCMNPQEKTRLAFECTRWLIGHPRTRHTAQAMLADLAAYTDPAVLPDMYGQGELIGDFEKQVAELLGKPAGVFMPSGTMAQQIALRIHADRSHTPHVAFHPTVPSGDPRAERLSTAARLARCAGRFAVSPDDAGRSQERQRAAGCAAARTARSARSAGSCRRGMN